MRIRLETRSDDGGGDRSGVAVDVDVSAGGRLAQIVVGTQPLLRPPHTDDRRALDWGCYPMAPWAGRLRGGHFELDGTLHHFAPNFGEHAIHGLVFDREWTIDEQQPTTLTMSCALPWALGGSATHRLALAPDHLTCELTVEAGTRPIAAEVGWHPWFLRADRLELDTLAMYERGPDHLPTGRTIRPVAPPWDDCFLATGPANLHYGRSEAPRVVVASDCDHWVIFTEPADATCVEPQSGPPDAFNLRPRRLEPGEHLRRWMTISW